MKICQLIDFLEGVLEEDGNLDVFLDVNVPEKSQSYVEVPVYDVAVSYSEQTVLVLNGSLTEKDLDFLKRF